MAAESREMMMLVLAALLLAAAGACGAGTNAPTPAPTATQTASPNVLRESEATPAPAPIDLETEVKYRGLVRDMIDGFGQLTRIMTNVRIGLASSPEDTTEAEETVGAIIGSFDLAREQMEASNPPAGYEEVHRELLDALDFYTTASAALLPDGETGKPDFDLFQEMMLQGGKNTHAAGERLSELARPSD